METPNDSDPDFLPTSPTAVPESQSPTNQSEINRYLKEYPYAAEPTYFTRPNRYHGPASTWRAWTADDRAIAESLETARAQDLSIHLYNAFDLKRRARVAINDNSNNAQSSDDDQRDVDKQFVPPTVWTAWPLRGKHVPRDSNLQDVTDLGDPRSQAQKPSTGLAEALLATTLKHAKEKWNARKIESDVLPVRPAKRDWKNERNSSKADESAPGDDENASDLEAAMDIDNDDEALNNLPPGTQLFSSQAFAAPDSSSSEDETSADGSEGEQPVFSADEDSARELLRPTIQHVLDRFTDLLDGLHTARAAYALKGAGSRSRSQSQSIFSSTERTDDENFIRTGSRAASRRGRKRKRSVTVSYDTEGNQQSSRSRGRSTPGKSKEKTQTLNPRDWSDVIGMATLKGWSIDTVARAGERCTRLFDQNMAFRTFHQGAADNKDVSTKDEPWFEEELAYVPDNAAEVRTTRASPLDTTTTTLLRTIESTTYVRTSHRCTNCISRRTICQPPADPYLASIQSETVPCAACTSSTSILTPCSGITIKIQTPSHPQSVPKTCPYPTCPRNNPTKPFAKNYHLQRHLKDVHGHVYSPPTSPATAPATPDQDRIMSSEPDARSEGDLRVSADLRCPVVSCPRSGMVYTRATRLYEHVRRKHPEVDLGMLKRIVGGPDGRGRYVRKGRSGSRGQDSGEREGNGRDGSISDDDRGRVDDDQE